MTDPNSAEAINAHFEELGALTFEQEDGRTLGIKMYACQSCGSLIAVREPHWATHQALGLASE